jgi:hypothetical protein
VVRLPRCARGAANRGRPASAMAAARASSLAAAFGNTGERRGKRSMTEARVVDTEGNDRWPEPLDRPGVPRTATAARYLIGPRGRASHSAC